MQYSARRASYIAAFFLIVTVVTQLIYIGLRSAEIEFDSSTIWTIEAVAFLAISVFALVPMARGSAHTAAWAAVALGGAFNVIQVGMGLAMFGPVSEAGEALAPVYQSILAGAFFLYFAGKFLFGFAGILLGLHLIRIGGGAAKAVGALAALTGLGALATNLMGMSAGMDMVMIAGAAGTAATLFLAMAAGMLAQTEAG
ncbi:hypothetical protein HKD42_09040 [Altererythrobacter sp. RZ02]|uniref:Thiamine biosynthesis protein ThiC n=1 Tax=Pontixanthobacter rizhaonensis TaxID=2730337 RepID=A0A848QPZ3_9SPHN|nr:hypothetical protein [Pontixanthobacter rizhaonensis]NMW32205.1 hypothetical protein [Pontixanthobacter rizhaonensis]